MTHTAFLRRAEAFRSLASTLRRQTLAAFADRCERDARALERAYRAETRRFA